MYQGVPTKGCFRLLNAKGAVGCQAKRGTTGILYQISTPSDITTFLTSAPPDQNYAVIIPYSLFTRETVSTLQSSNKLAGILLAKDGFGYPRPTEWSIETTCPNCEYGLYANEKDKWHQWNPKGNGLAYENFGVPIYGVAADQNNARSAVPIKEAVASNAAKRYVEYPLYAVEFDAHMWAARDAQTCLRREWCDPLGGVTVWSTFSEIGDLRTEKQIIVVSAKMDSKSFIYDSPGVDAPVFSVGAESAKTGLVTALAVAQALGKVIRGPNPPALTKHILFTFFDGESWGFAGSQRFVRDISTPFTCHEASSSATPSCPFTEANCTTPCFTDTEFTNIDFERIESIVEFDSVGHLWSGDTLGDGTIWMHVDQMDEANVAWMNRFVGSDLLPPVNNTPVTGRITLAPAATAEFNPRLPPSSSMSFLKKRAIPAVVFGDYRTEFSNRYYQSEFDDGSLWDDRHVSLMCALANVTARAVFADASGNAVVPDTLNADCGFVKELMECFTRNISCTLAGMFWPPLKGSATLHDSAASGVFNYGTNISPYIVSQLLTNITATDRVGTCSVNEDCPNEHVCSLYTSQHANGTAIGTCIRGFTRFHWAYGTGIEKNYQTNKWEVVDPELGTWTRSRTDSADRRDNFVRLRIFQTASPGYEAVQLGVGICVTAATVVVAWFGRKWAGRNLKGD
ncbi:Nicastrin-domain-containing protein [Gaertneriomyces semiglobifer]|nr:Nicastrin-domain-containing protein [Gaertneriomyces semiglobifer]